MAGQEGGPLVLGIDLGGTKVVAGVVDAEHRILGRAKRPTPAREGAAAILQALVDVAGAALAEARTRPEDLAGVGVGSPGPLDAEAGVILFSPNMNVRDFALGPDLARALGRPVLVQNDVRVAGYGEFRLGAGRGFQDILAAFVGTGIGGCIIQQGRILTGTTGNAGEIGHVIVKAGGPPCGCGGRGCLEALASRTAITRRMQKAVRKGVATGLGRQLSSKSSQLKSKDLAAAVRSGDPLAVKEVGRAARFLGLALGGLVNLLAPQIVIIGGGVTEALGNPWVDQVAAVARNQAMADPKGKVQIERAALGDDAGLLGAALMARERFAG
ncbi:MAG TPA: ROK family protein [Isosphaeraceae bacterium]